MSYQVAGRMSWLVSWLDHWRGHALTNHADHDAPHYWRPRAWMNWLATRGRNHDHVDHDHVDHDWLNSVSSQPADEDLISQSLAARQLRDSVQQLPSHERQVLLLHVSHGLTYWEIAARLGMDEEVVLRDLAHAYSQLRLELSTDEPRR